MKFIRQLCIYFSHIYILFCSGCTTQNSDSVLHEFKVTKKLTHIQSNIKNDDIGEVVDILVKDTILITNQMFNEYIFKIFNVKTGETLCQCISKGKGPGEMLKPNLINEYNDSLFSTFDVNRKELIYCSYDGLCHEDPNSIIYHKLNYNAFRAYPLNDSLVICTGIFDEGQFILVNMHSKKIIATQDYPSIDNLGKFNNVIKGLLLQGEMALRPGHAEFVYVCNGADIIEMGNIHDNLINNTLTKVYSLPKFEVRGNTPVHPKESKFAFHSLIGTQKYFYVIYSGNSMAEKGSEFTAGRNLLVYNWKGEPIINFELDRAIKRMTFDERKRIIYGYCTAPTTGEPEFVTYQLPRH
jgi:hypothetical protein